MKEKYRDMGKRYTMFLAGILFSALGISLITKAGFGNIPCYKSCLCTDFSFSLEPGNIYHVGQLCSFSYSSDSYGKGF